MDYPMLESDLKKLQSQEEFQSQSFGVSRVQRYLRIGYNRASSLVNTALERGILVRDEEVEWLVRLATK